MSGKCIEHRRIPWVSGIVRKIHATSYAIDMRCSRCSERGHSRYCCFDKCRDIGLEAFAKLHVACVEPVSKEKVL